MSILQMSQNVSIGPAYPRIKKTDIGFVDTMHKGRFRFILHCVVKWEADIRFADDSKR